MNCYEIATLLVQLLVALGTIGAVIVALYQTTKNQKQFDQAQREQRELRERQQADNVAAWFDDHCQLPADEGDKTPFQPRRIIIANRNALPIYNVVVTVVSLYGAGPHVHGEDNEGEFPCRLLFHEITPGTWGDMIKTHGGAMGLDTTLEIAFTDASGQNWIRRGNGLLEKIEKSPIDFYRITLPASWSTPQLLRQFA